jgi:hypothetical protein
LCDVAKQSAVGPPQGQGSKTKEASGRPSLSCSCSTLWLLQSSTDLPTMIPFCDRTAASLSMMLKCRHLESTGPNYGERMLCALPHHQLRPNGSRYRPEVVRASRQAPWINTKYQKHGGILFHPVTIYLRPDGSWNDNIIEQRIQTRVAVRFMSSFP